MRCCFLSFVLALGTAPCVFSAEPVPDFQPQGRPFLQKYCLDCHSGAKPEAALTLEAYRDSASVVKQRKTWENVLKQLRSGAMPPEGETQPSPAEVEAFAALVTAVFEHADKNAKPDPGRVTMRRLNRVEYRNTIRDLIGVPFDPTEDFPQDDIGHGFDNIGDVLTISPVLMERYLNAADGIMAQAIVPKLPPVSKNWTDAQYVEPASGDVEKKLIEKKFRRMSSDATEAIELGPLHHPYKWDDDGEYIFRTRVFGQAEDGQPVNIAILLSGPGIVEPSSDEELASIVGTVRKPAKILEVFEVTSRQRDKAQTFELKLPPQTGRDRVLVGLMKPAEGAPPVKVFVNNFFLEGPLDTRPAPQKRLLATAEGLTTAERTREVLTRFLRRAYRRPASDDELKLSSSLVDRAMEAGESWEGGIQVAMQAALCSPKFLFRVELDSDPQSPTIRPLDEFQLASRLSYFLWSSMPDDTLLDLAQQGQLSANLESQVRRMLDDPKSSALVQNFAMQWLQIQRLQGVAPDNKLFPRFNDFLRAAMLKETELFVDSVFREDRSLMTLIDADYTFVNDRLAAHYGLPDADGGKPPQEGNRRRREDLAREREFRRVTLSDRTRGGLLTQASILTVTSNPTRTSPVKRGRWVLEQILGAPPPPPPPNVPELPNDEKEAATGSLRQRMEIHRSNPSCANCHAKMDPIGFALENFDAVGAYRTKDGNFDIDASGEFPDGAKFNGAADLKTIVLARKDEFRRCFTEKLLVYALGRGLEYYDRPVVEQILRNVAAGDDKVSILITQIVLSDPFRQRRGLE